MLVIYIDKDCQMKKLLLLCILSASFNSYSKEVTKAQEANCINAMAMAEAAMTVRQSGLPLLIALKNNEKMLANGDATKEEFSLMKIILRDVYSKPKYSTKEYQEESINEYSAKYYLACMEAYESL